MHPFQWLKNNKIVALLILVIFFLLFRKSSTVPIYNSISNRSTGLMMEKAAPASLNYGGSVSDSYMPPPVQEFAPSDATNRLVIQNSDLSLLVKNVKQTANQITDFAKNNGGFMISSSLNNPNEQGTGNITIRVPSRKFKETLTFLEGLSVKVVYENLYGEDVTDQYTDISARLQTLNTTKAKFEEILTKANQVQDILNVEREIINLQSQIDSLKGQELYLEKSAELSKITVYLATDELELPYAPKENWRSEVIVKTAIRSLVQNLRDMVSATIWIGVYAIIWLPLLLITLFLKRKFYKRTI